VIAVTDYTSYAEIRAVLGVDSLELSDTTLALTIYSAALHRALRGFTDDSGKSLAAYYDDINPLSMTDDEEAIYYTIKEYATYIVAESCCSGLSMFALKSDSDGKAAQSRFGAESTFKDVVKNIRIRLAGLTGTLDSLLGGTAESAVPGLTVVPPNIDLVTNE